MVTESAYQITALLSHFKLNFNLLNLFNIVNLL